VSQKNENKTRTNTRCFAISVFEKITLDIRRLMSTECAVIDVPCNYAWRPGVSEWKLGSSIRRCHV